MISAASSSAGGRQVGAQAPAYDGYNDPPARAIQIASAVDKDREQRLISARKKLKNYRLKQAARTSTGTAHAKRASLGGTHPPPSPAGHGRSHSRHHSRQHSRQHSRSQSRSSLAAVLAGPKDGARMEEAVAHQRRLSARFSRGVDAPAATNERRLSTVATAPPPSSVPSPPSGSNGSGHVRRESKHRRSSSVATRRESMEVMGGLALKASHSPSPTSPAGSPHPVTPPSPIPPQRVRPFPDVDALTGQRLAALSALEGRVRAPSREIALPVFAEDGDGLLPGKNGGKKVLGASGPPPRSPSAQFAADTTSPLMGMLAEGNASESRPSLIAFDASPRDKRASWGLGLAGSVGRLGTGPMAMPSIGAQWGGNGGMGRIRDLGSVVEEPEEEDDNPTPIVQNRLFASTRTIDTVTEEDEVETDSIPRVDRTPPSKTPQAGPRRRPQSLILPSPTKSHQTAISTSTTDTDTLTSSEGIASPDVPRPLRTLSLSARASTGPAALRAFSLASPEPVTGSGPHSALGASASGGYVSPARERRRNSLFAGPLSGSTTSAYVRSRSGSAASTATQATNKTRSSISYSKSPATEPTVEAAPVSSVPSPELSKADPGQSVSLASALLAASTAREEADTLRAQLCDVEAERDMLREDVDGWRVRVGDLERGLQAEKAKLEDERREVLAGRERIRKLGDRLAAASAAADSPSGEQDEVKQMTAAQAKLIGEMRDQIFALAGALERERADHLVTKEALERAALQIEVNSYEEDEPADPTYQDDGSPALDEPSPPRDGPKRHQGSDASAFSSGTSFGSQFANTTADTSVADDESVAGKSPAAMSSGTVLRSRESGGLGTLAEEDEDYDEEAAIDSRSAEATDSTVRPDLTRARMDSASTQSAASEAPPKTPSCVDPPAMDPKASHHRSESFIRHWSFPRGPVPQVRMDDDDHCFFFRPNSVEMTLPALEPGRNALETPPFLLSYLEHDESDAVSQVSETSHVRRPSSPRPRTRDSISLKRLSATAPPPSRSAHVSAALSSASASSAASALAVFAPQRLSLQNLSNWVGSYVSSGPPAAATRMLACGHEDDVGSIAVISQDMTALARKHAMMEAPAPPRFVKAARQPVPVGAPLHKLDFTGGWLGVFGV